jgi:hypothetical protein
MSLTAPSESVARMLAQKSGRLDTSSNLHMASTTRGADCVFEVAGDKDSVRVLWIDAINVVSTPESGQTTWTISLEQVAHTKEMRARKMFTVPFQSLLASSEGVARTLASKLERLDTPAHLHIESATCRSRWWSHFQLADFVLLGSSDILKASHDIPAGRFDSVPEVYIALSYSRTRCSSARSKIPSFASFAIKWTTSESGPPSAKMIRNRVSMPRHLISSTKAYEINQRRIYPPTEPSAADIPDCITAEVSSVQSEIPIPRSENTDCVSVPVDCPADSSQYGLPTSDMTAQVPQRSRSQQTALERRMNEILADWERCQEDSDSDSESNSDLDIHAGSPSASEASNDYRAEYSRDMCYTRRGDATPSGAPESSAMDGTGSGNRSRTSENSLLGQATQPLQEIGDGDSVDSSELLIADDQEHPKEEGAKVMSCPMKDCTGEDCTGKDSTMSELL